VLLLAHANGLVAHPVLHLDLHPVLLLTHAQRLLPLTLLRVHRIELGPNPSLLLVHPAVAVDDLRARWRGNAGQDDGGENTKAIDAHQRRPPGGYPAFPYDSRKAKNRSLMG